mmetsp:Transcript_16845/g.43022  ORF Transcript_16845/g.43022 Transcript_16845/m.43022 type:complete len:290 (-) Transcript_16845:1024-1893(-)
MAAARRDRTDPHRCPRRAQSTVWSAAALPPLPPSPRPCRKPPSSVGFSAAPLLKHRAPRSKPQSTPRFQTLLLPRVIPRLRPRLKHPAPRLKLRRARPRQPHHRLKLWRQPQPRCQRLGLRAPQPWEVSFRIAPNRAIPFAQGGLTRPTPLSRSLERSDATNREGPSAAPAHLSTPPHPQCRPRQSELRSARPTGSPWRPRPLKVSRRLPPARASAWAVWHAGLLSPSRPNVPQGFPRLTTLPQSSQNSISARMDAARLQGPCATPHPRPRPSNRVGQECACKHQPRPQ